MKNCWYVCICVCVLVWCIFKPAVCGFVFCLMFGVLERCRLWLFFPIDDQVRNKRSF